MTSPEPPNSRWRHVQATSSERLGRIGQILRIATTEIASEVKSGSSEVNYLSREALTQWIAGQKANSSGSPMATPDQPMGWGPIWSEVTQLVQERKSVWGQQLLVRLQAGLARFDAEMSQNFGDRYGRVRQPVIELINRVTHPGKAPVDANAERGVLNVEVMPPGSKFRE